MADYKVAEIFTSINGEGRLAGQLAVFVRLCGCNLHCSYCDTRWANAPDAPYTLLSDAEIYDRIRETHIRNVTLTGGEPLAAPQISVLLNRLAADRTLRVEIETNGSISLAPYAGMENRPAMTMDYKLGGSGMEAHMCLENFSLLCPQDTVKFVCGSEQDLQQALAVIESFRLCQVCAVYLSPVFGKLSPARIVDFMKEHALNNVNLQLQLHKFIWDPNARGV